MSLIYICPACDTHYDSDIVNNIITYFIGNKREGVKSPDEPCHECQGVIDTARTEAIKKIKEGKNGQKAAF